MIIQDKKEESMNDFPNEPYNKMAIHNAKSAQCLYCSKTTESHPSLPFWEHKPNDEYDKYYCGCFGWD